MEAIRVIEEYEYERKVEHEPMDDVDDTEPEECDDCGRISCVCEYANNCHCGAWGWGKNGVVHVSDCICGGGI